MALVLHEVGAAEKGPLLQKAGDAADLALNGLAARLGGVRGEDRVELEAVQQLDGMLAAHLVHQLVEGNRELVCRIGRRARNSVEHDAALALAERLDAVVLLREVRQVEEGGEGANQDLRVVDIEAVDEGHGIAEGGGARSALGRDALGVDGLAHGVGAGVALVGRDHAGQELVEKAPHLWVVLVEDLALQAQEQRQMVA